MGCGQGTAWHAVCCSCAVACLLGSICNLGGGAAMPSHRSSPVHTSNCRPSNGPVVRPAIVGGDAAPIGRCRAAVLAQGCGLAQLSLHTCCICAHHVPAPTHTRHPSAAARGVCASAPLPARWR